MQSQILVLRFAKWVRRYRLCAGAELSTVSSSDILSSWKWKQVFESPAATEAAACAHAFLTDKVSYCTDKMSKISGQFHKAVVSVLEGGEDARLVLCRLKPWQHLVARVEVTLSRNR